MMKNILYSFFVAFLFSSNCNANEQLLGIADYRPYGWSEYLAILYIDKDSDLENINRSISTMKIIITKEKITKNSFFKSLINQVAINVEPSDLEKQLSNFNSMKNFFRGSLEQNDHIIVKKVGKSALIYINDILFSLIESPEFLNVLSKAWIGNIPPSSQFKHDLIGGTINENLINLSKLHSYSLLRQNVIRDWRFTYENEYIDEQSVSSSSKDIKKKSDLKINEAGSSNKKTELATTARLKPSKKEKTEKPLEKENKDVVKVKVSTSKNTGYLKPPTQELTPSTGNNSPLEFDLSSSISDSNQLIASSGNIKFLKQENPNDNNIDHSRNSLLPSRNISKSEPLNKVQSEKNNATNTENTKDTDNVISGYLERKNEIIDQYRILALREINRFKAIPKQAIVRRQNGNVILQLEVDKDGNIIRIEITDPSPYKALNKQAIEAIEKASPLAPIPEVLGLNKLALDVQITYPKYF